MCIGLFGVQIVWGLQNGNTSRIFQTLGANIDELAILWIAGPAAGLLVQPVIGYLSDRTWTPLGRRRPYLFGGALLAGAALWAMPHAPSLMLASLMLWLLTASINIAMEPFRALVADTMPEEQRTTGFAMQVFFIGAGAVFASALPWMLTHWFGIDGQGRPGVVPDSVRYAFTIGAIGLVAAVSWSVFTTRERRPDRAAQTAADPHLIPSAEGAAKLVRQGWLWILGGIALAAAAGLGGWERETYVVAVLAAVFGLAQLGAVWMRRAGHASIGMFEIVEDILHMPLLLRRLAVVQFFTWFGLFAMWIYTTPSVAAQHYGAPDPGTPGYNEAADWVGVLFAGYNGVASLVALLLPLVTARLGRPVTHALCLACGGLGLAGFLVIRDPALLWLPAAGIGIAWAGILSLPYAMLSSAVPPSKTGVYMGIHNVFLVLPQLVAATVLGALVGEWFEGRAIAALALSAGSFGLAALFALTLPRSPGRHG
ncbi:MAG: MFS transporter [Sphingomonas sp.]|nr:MFS transporter [Sphingomonas sp.]